MAGCADCPNGELHQRVGMLEQQHARMTAVLENLDRNMSELVQIGKAQVRIEMQQVEQGKALERCFDEVENCQKVYDHVIDRHDQRIKALENDAPKNKLLSSWALHVFQWLALLGLGSLLGKSFL